MGIWILIWFAVAMIVAPLIGCAIKHSMED